MLDMSAIEPADAVPDRKVAGIRPENSRARQVTDGDQRQSCDGGTKR